MKKTFILTLAMMVAVIFSANAQWPNNSGSGTLSSGAKDGVKWDQTEVDYGELIKDEPTDAVFKMTNTGSKPVFITNAKASCGCTAISYPKRPIRPGETVDVTTTYTPDSYGTFNKTVTLTLNIEESTQILRLNGIVREN